MSGIQRFRWLVLAFGALMSSGCGSGEERPPVYQVTGTVTRNGTPLEGAVVTFSPAEAGRAASGTTDASGKYTLTTWAKDDGAELGRYRVTITKYDSPPDQADAAATGPAEVDLDNLVLEEEYPADYDEMAASQEPSGSKNLLPPKYAVPETSGFEAQVTEDEEKNVFDFKLDG